MVYATYVSSSIRRNAISLRAKRDVPIFSIMVSSKRVVASRALGKRISLVIFFRAKYPSYQGRLPILRGVCASCNQEVQVIYVDERRDSTRVIHC